jgi:plastocyanin
MALWSISGFIRIVLVAGILFWGSDYQIGMAKSIALRQYHFRFLPDQIVVKRGENTRIIISNEDAKVHNFILPAFYIFTSPIPARKKTYVEFSPDKSGVFPFYSDYSDDKERGMVGKILVQ